MTARNETTNPQDDALIASFFEAEKQTQSPPSDALLARVLGDAADFVPVAPLPVHPARPSWWRRLPGADLWVGGATIAASALLGVTIGMADTATSTLVPGLAEVQNALTFNLDAEFASYGDTPFDFALLED